MVLSAAVSGFSDGTVPGMLLSKLVGPIWGSHKPVEPKWELPYFVSMSITNN